VRGQPLLIAALAFRHYGTMIAITAAIGTDASGRDESI